MGGLMDDDPDADRRLAEMTQYLVETATITESLQTAFHAAREVKDDQLRTVLVGSLSRASELARQLLEDYRRRADIEIEAGRMGGPTPFK